MRDRLVSTGGDGGEVADLAELGADLGEVAADLRRLRRQGAVDRRLLDGLERALGGIEPALADRRDVLADRRPPLLLLRGDPRDRRFELSGVGPERQVVRPKLGELGGD